MPTIISTFTSSGINTLHFFPGSGSTGFQVVQINAAHTAAKVTYSYGSVSYTTVYLGSNFQTTATGDLSGTISGIYLALTSDPTFVIGALEFPAPVTMASSRTSSFVSYLTGNDTIVGGGGNDTLYAGPNNAGIAGGDGNDTINFQSNHVFTNDVIVGGSSTVRGTTNTGFDTINFLSSGATAIVADARGATFLDIENMNIGANETVILGTAQIGAGLIAANAHVGGVTSSSAPGAPRTLQIVDSTPGTASTIDLSAIYLTTTFGAVGNTDTIIIDASAATTNRTILAPTTVANLGGGGDNLRYTITSGSGNDTITGSARADQINGGAGDDTLYGGLGNDTLISGVGSDTLIGDAGNDTVDYSGLVTTGVTVAINGYYGGATKGGANGSDGLALVERFIGSSGNDYFSMLGGAYQATGGAGNDIYIIDNSGTGLTEAANGGTDWVVSSASSTTLAGNFEYLGMTANNAVGTDTSTTGSVILDASGSGITLNGGLSDNLYLVHGANTTLTDLGGVNTVVAYVNTTLTSAFRGNDTMVVLGNNITATGNNYGNTLMSIGTGNRLVGGSGNDIFIVTTGSEIITESAAGGFDTVWSQTGVYTMPANAEQLVLLQAGARGIANAAGSLVVAASTNNTLQSGTGSDTLWSNGQNVTYDMTGPGFGHDTLANFKGHSTGSLTADVIDLRAFHLTGMSALTFTDSTAGVTISISGNAADNILVSGYNHAQLQASDFLF
jgi:RTX calcium-binding nonapeptide repeat (4 copies)